MSQPSAAFSCERPCVLISPACVRSQSAREPAHWSPESCPSCSSASPRDPFCLGPASRLYPFLFRRSIMSIDRTSSRLWLRPVKKPGSRCMPGNCVSRERKPKQNGSWARNWSGLGDAVQLKLRRKNDPQKLAIAARLRRETTLSLKALAARVGLSSPKGANSTLHRSMRQQPENASGTTAEVGIWEKAFYAHRPKLWVTLEPILTATGCSEGWVRRMLRVARPAP